MKLLTYENYNFRLSNIILSWGKILFFVFLFLEVSWACFFHFYGHFLNYKGLPLGVGFSIFGGEQVFFTNELPYIVRTFIEWSSGVRLSLPANRDLFFNEPANQVMEKIIDFHHDIFFFLVVIVISVVYLLIKTIY